MSRNVFCMMMPLMRMDMAMPMYMCMMRRAENVPFADCFSDK